MVTITKRSVKGSPLTNDEVDANFDNLNTGKLEITASTGSATVPKGTTAQRDGSPATGMIRYNSTLEEFEGYTDNGWIGIGDGLDSAEVIQLGHDALDGFVSDEHIAHSGVNVVAGAGLTGGGSIAASRTINVVGGTGITVNADNITTTDGEIVHDNLSGFVANEHIDHSGVTLTAGTGLSGGGTITANRTFNIDSAEFLAAFESSINHDNLTAFVANEHIDHTSVSVTAGAGLTGGGTLASTRDIAVGAGTGITVNADNITTNDGAIVHDNLSGFVANEHIDHSGVSIVAGTGLTGGGTITANRTLNVIGGVGIDANADDVAIDSAEFLAYFNPSIVHDNLSGFVANEHIDHTGVSVVAGAGLTGGGTIAASRTLNVIAGTGITVNADNITTNDGQIVHDNLSGFVANEHIDHTGVSVVAGAGLTGGGTIAASRTLNVIAGTGITVNADNITTNDGQIVHDNLSGFVANEHIDHSGVTLTAGTGMTGGGTIAASRTFNVAGVTSSMFSSASTVLIKNAAGTTLKTIRSPGS